MLPQSGIAFMFAGRFKFGQPNRWANGERQRVGFTTIGISALRVPLLRGETCPVSGL
jgi:hypothetical protein